MFFFKKNIVKELVKLANAEPKERFYPETLDEIRLDMFKTPWNKKKVEAKKKKLQDPKEMQRRRLESVSDFYIKCTTMLAKAENQVSTLRSQPGGHDEIAFIQNAATNLLITLRRRQTERVFSEFPNLLQQYWTKLEARVKRITQGE